VKAFDVYSGQILGTVLTETGFTPVSIDSANEIIVSVSTNSQTVQVTSLGNLTANTLLSAINKFVLYDPVSGRVLYLSLVGTYSSVMFDGTGSTVLYTVTTGATGSMVYFDSLNGVFFVLEVNGATWNLLLVPIAGGVQALSIDSSTNTPGSTPTNAAFLSDSTQLFLLYSLVINGNTTLRSTSYSGVSIVIDTLAPNTGPLSVSSPNGVVIYQGLNSALKLRQTDGIGLSQTITTWTAASTPYAQFSPITGTVVYYIVPTAGAASVSISAVDFTLLGGPTAYPVDTDSPVASATALVPLAAVFALLLTIFY